MQSVLVHDMEDKGELQKNKEAFCWGNNADIIRKIGHDKTHITFINKHGEEVRISLLDLDSIGDLDHDYIVEMLNYILGVSISSHEGIEKINNLAKTSYDYLRDNLLYTNSELRSIGNIKFSSSLEVVKFLQSTNNSNGLKKCILAKIARLYLDGFSLDVEEKRKKTMAVLENKVLSNLRDLSTESSLSYEGYESAMEEFKQSGEASMDGSMHVPLDNDINLSRKISFKIHIREKTIESTISKALREKDYINQGDIMDLLGITIVCNSADKVEIMDKISQIAFKYGEYRIKNKGGVTLEDLSQVLENENIGGIFESNIKFFLLLEESFREAERRMSTAVGYKDIKIVPTGDGNKLSFEVMFLDYDSSNNDGLSNHKAFKYKRKISERIRLEQYISLVGIQIISHALIEDISNSKIVDLKGKKPTDLLKEILVDIIYESQGRLVPRNSSKEYRDVIYKEVSELEEREVDRDVVIGRVNRLTKLEVQKVLEDLLPQFYLFQLLPYSDSNGNISRTKRKYTNSIGLENLSVLSRDVTL